MKKPLLLLALWASIFTYQTARANGGTSCATAVSASAGTNTSTHTGISDDQWFIYTPGSDLLLTISSCGLTAEGTSFKIYTSCNTDDLNLAMYNSSACGNTAPFQATKTFQVTAGIPILIKWNNPGHAVSYNWTITEESLPNGSNSTTAIQALEGINHPNYHHGNSVDQWYYFSPNADGVFTIAQPNGATTHFNGAIYKESDLINPIGRFDQTSGYQSQIKANEKYYIEFNQNSDDNYDWNLSFQSQTISGYVCSSPIIATTGSNTVKYYQTDQWFSYQPTIDGVMTVSTVGLTTQDTYEEIYDNCNAAFLYNCDTYRGGTRPVNQSSITMNVVKDKPYLIKWRKDFTTASYPFNISVRPYFTGKNITSFGLPNQIGNSAIDSTNYTIAAVVGSNVDRSSLIASFKLSTGATATATGSATPQVSGTTSNNFTSSVIYTVKPESGATQDWTVTVTNAIVPSSAKDIESYSFTNSYIVSNSTIIDKNNHTITVHAIYSIPNTLVQSLVANFTLSSYATATIGGTPEVSGTTANDYTNSLIYTVKAQDGTTQNWTVQLIIDSKPLGETLATPATAVEGANQANSLYANQYYIYTPTQTGFVILGYCSTTVNKVVAVYSDVSASHQIKSQTVYCGNALQVPVTKDVPVYIQWQNIKNESWTLTSGVFSGKDITVFTPASSVSTVLNQTTHTITAVVERTVDLSAVPISFTLSPGATLFNGATQLSTNDHVDFTNPVTLTVKAQDGTTQNYIVIITKRSISTGNSMLSFFLNSELGPAVIDNTNHTVKLGVQSGTDLTSLIPNFGLSDYATAKISGVTQTSTQSMVDFTYPVTYAVTSESGVEQDWTVTVTTTAVQNIYANMTSFRLNEQTQTATIDAGTRAISVNVVYGTNLSALIPTFYMSSGATAKVGTTAQVSGTTANNFSSPVVYSITSEDGLTTLVWTVTVTVAKNTAAAISAFTLAGQSGSTINAPNKSISVVMPYGATVNSLVGTFTYSTGATINVGATAQFSGTSANDFTNPVVYTVLAEDGTTSNNWTVTVTIAKNSATDITAFSLAGQTSSSIDDVNKTIAVSMPYLPSVNNLIGNFTLSNGAILKVGPITQVSGTTANDFSNAVVYTVVAENGITTQNWTVTVTVAKNTAAAISAFTLAGQYSSTINAPNKSISVVMPYGSTVSSLVGTFTYSTGATVKVGTTAQVSGTTANNFSSPVVYSITSEDGLTTLDWTVTVTANNTATDITAFSLTGQTSSSIDDVNKTIAVSMPYLPSANNLIGSFTLSNGAILKVGPITQVSGTTTNDFSSPVVYTVIAENGITTQNWTVTVTVAKNTATEITAFSLAGQTSSSIDNANKTIAVIMPTGSSSTNLVGTFTVSGGATVKIGTTAQISATTANDYTSPVVYTVLAEDGTTTQNWTVSVAIATYIGTINETVINMYPNPTTNGFYIYVGDETSTLSIFNLSGSVLLTQQITGKTYINVSTLHPGIYIVKANGLTGKLVKN